MSDRHAHVRLRRGSHLRAVVTVAVMVAATSGPLVLQAGSVLASADEPATVRPIDLDAPETGITDPLARVAPMARDCLAGQIDINSASAQQLAAGLGIPSGPTVQRVIDMRPWLKPADLISVPGMPVAKLSRFVERGCATPTTLPVSSPRACPSGTSAVDLQSASATRIAAGLGLPRNTAEALVNARPLPQDLAQVTAPRIPGLSRPTLDRLTQSGKICVTPNPFRYDGTTWRWVGSTSGAVVEAADDPRYALIVPPGRVQSPSGVWGSVTPELGAELPKADFHLHGNWTPEVAGRLPNVSEGSPGIIHELEDGSTAVSWGSSVVSNGETVVTALNSLSTSESVDRDPLCSGRAPSDVALVFCSSNPRDVLLNTVVNERAASASQYIARVPDGGSCGNSGRAVSRGNVLFGMVCHPADRDTYGEWRIGNYSGGELWGGLFSSFGSVVQSSPLQADGFDTEVVVDDSRYGPVGEVVAKALGNAGVMLADTEVVVRKVAGSGESTFRYQAANEKDLALLWALFNVFEVADAGLNLAGIDDLGSIGAVKCITGASVDMAQVSVLIDCLESAVGQALDLAAEEARGRNSKKLADRLESSRKFLKKASLIAEVPGVGASLVFHLGARVSLSNDVTLQYLSPAAGVGSGPGRPGASPYNWDLDGLANDGTFIARTTETNSSGVKRSYLVNAGTGVALEIPNGGEYECYARKRLVFDFVDVHRDSAGARFLNVHPKAEVFPGFARPCTWEVPENAWNGIPRPEGNVPFNVILRADPVGGQPARTALVNNAGVLQEIREPGVYVCLAAQTAIPNPVIWNVSTATFENWPVRGPDATCGP